MKQQSLASTMFPEPQRFIFIPTMSQERDILSSSSSVIELSVLNTPMRLPSCRNLRVIARVSTSSVALQSITKVKAKSYKRIYQSNTCRVYAFVYITHKFPWYSFLISNHLKFLHISSLRYYIDLLQGQRKSKHSKI